MFTIMLTCYVNKHSHVLGWLDLAVLPEGLNQLPLREILFTVILTLVI
jgi:hypothetical protein